MKKLKYVGVDGDEHLWRYKNTEYAVHDIIASLFVSEQTGQTSLCWLMRSGSVIYPVESRRDVEGIDIWNELLKKVHPSKLLLVNPVTGGQERRKHPVIKAFENYTNKISSVLMDFSDGDSLDIPEWRIADANNKFVLKQALDDLKKSEEIQWSFYDGARKTEEMINRGDLANPSIGALAQGITYLWQKEIGSTGGYIPGSLVGYPSGKGDNYRRMAGGVFRIPGRSHRRFIR
ncbi:MAG: hypothetical protein AAGF93_01680 [Cyanobacteria bacterium P01_H01_bin.105]